MGKRRAVFVLCGLLVGLVSAGCKSDDDEPSDAGGGDAAQAQVDSSVDVDKDSSVGVDAATPRSAKPEDIEAVCKVLVDCDLIPGKDLTMEYCSAEISDACVACSLANNGADAGVDDAGDGCPPRSSACSNECGFLVQPPESYDECIEIQGTSPAMMGAAYDDCVCKNCLTEYADCKSDEGCWRIVQCAVEKNCNGNACYQLGTCMKVIDEVGVTALGTVLSTEFGMCTAQCLGM